MSGRLGALRNALPRGQTLPVEDWRTRHRGIVVLLWAHALFIPIFGLIRGFHAGHVVYESAVVPFAAVFASTPALSRRLRTIAASMGLLFASAILVHLSGGVIEMHFHFFVMVAVVALYQDWLPFLLSVAYVLVHHGVVGVVDPHSVFNHYAAINNPWKWAGIHALFIAGMSAACLVTWSLDEKILDQRRVAEDRLREETQVVETLNQVGRRVAAELDLHAVVQHVTDAATDLTAAAFGAFFYNVTDDAGESYMLYTLSGVPREAFSRFPMPRNTAVFAPTFNGEGVVRLDDVTADPRYGQSAPYFGMPEGHLPLRSYLAVPVRSARGDVLGGLFFGHSEVGRFTETDERLAVGVAAHAAVAIDNANLYAAQRTAREEAERAQHRLALLAEASRVLAGSLELDLILRNLTRLVAPAVADHCTVLLADEDGQIHQVAGAAEPRVEAALAAFVPRPVRADDPVNPIARVVRTSESMVFDNIDQSLINAAASDEAHAALIEGAQLTSAIVVPLTGRDRAIGALALSTSTASGRRLREPDVALAEELGRRAAVAVEHARLYASQRSAAETLQHSLLPDVLPHVPGVSVASRYMPGGPDVEVGGDWYDVLELPDGLVALVMGDVVGRGVPAASLMGQLRNALRAYALEGLAPSMVLTRLNQLIHDLVDSQQMATLVVVQLDPETGGLRYSNAGHPPPLIWGGARPPSFLEGGTGVPLGAVAGAVYRDATHTLAPGETLLLYTDGLVEDRNTPLDVGLERLQVAASSGPDELEALCEHLSQQAPGKQRSHDDMAMLAVRWLPLGAHLHLELPTHARVMRPLRAALRRWLADAGATEQESFEVIVAACEACSNAIKHGAADATSFELEGELDGDVRIVIRNAGPWRSRRASAPGGRGLDIIRQFMDTADVSTEGGTTEVRMRRTLSRSEARRSSISAG